MYDAIVTRITNVREHSNADKVKLATCVGNQVVVGLNAVEGTLGVYFATDGRLSHEFCYNNNLYRDSDMNKDKNVKPGMFDANRRVRTQKFRGEVSDGFWVELDTFNFLNKKGLDIEHMEFSEWDGVKICEKYVNEKTTKAASQNTNKKLKTAKSSIMFKELPDTTYIGKNIHTLTDNDLLVSTIKMHGCVHYDTLVETLEYGEVKIGWLVENKINCNIKAYDTIYNEIIYAPIDDFYFLENNGEWYEIELENGIKITITGNNPVYLPDLNIYRRVDELTVDDYFLIDNKNA